MSNDRIESLLKIAGERDQPSAAGLQRARDAARAAWQRGLAQAPAAPAARRVGRPWMLAAACVTLLVAAVLVTLGYRDGEAGRELVARVDVASGDVSLDGRRAALSATTALLSGSELATHQESLALRLGDVLSLRVATHTRLRLDSPGRVTLLAGAVYVDSGGLNAPSTLRIVTPAGDVRHVGTQFQVAVSGARTRVQVREGRVLLGEAGAAPIELVAGDRIEVSGSDSRIDHGVPGFGEEWDWAAAAAPVMDIENRPLNEFLGWYTREHGWQLRFADAGLQSRSMEIRLHGSLAGLDAHSSLEYVGLITGVPLAVRDGVLWAGKAP